MSIRAFLTFEIPSPVGPFTSEKSELVIGGIPLGEVIHPHIIGIAAQGREAGVRQVVLDLVALEVRDAPEMVARVGDDRDAPRHRIPWVFLFRRLMYNSRRTLRRP
jgi:hypothetical protein